MITVDANVWVAAYDPHDRFHDDSVAFLSAVLDLRTPLYAPAVMPLEAACALARRTGRPEVGEDSFQRLQKVPGLELVPLDQELIRLAGRLGTRSFLRTADALYAATARATGSTCISWDSELVERASALLPTQWLSSSSDK